MKTAKSELPKRSSLVLALLLMGLPCALSPARAQSKPPAGSAGSVGQEDRQIPEGTVLPVRLNHGFSSKNARAGQVITGRLMQEVALPNAAKIPEGARLLGTILSVSPADNNVGGKLSLRFDQIEIHHRRSPIVTNLRALASLLEVEFAEIPETTPGFGTPYIWATTDQIGGDVKYGVGGPVTDHVSRPVGQGTYTGVLVHVRAQPGSKCRGALDAQDRLQALWVFSADACGIYGIAQLRIEHAGRTEPTGQITLAAETGDAKLQSGSGLLLRVIR